MLLPTKKQNHVNKCWGYEKAYYIPLCTLVHFARTPAVVLVIWLENWALPSTSQSTLHIVKFSSWKSFSRMKMPHHSEGNLFRIYDTEIVSSIITLFMFMERHNCNSASSYRGLSSACNGLVGFVLPENPTMSDPFSIRIMPPTLVTCASRITEPSKWSFTQPLGGQVQPTSELHTNWGLMLSLWATNHWCIIIMVLEKIENIRYSTLIL